jgi:hypothetical protein
MRQTVTDKIWLCIVEHYCFSWWASAHAVCQGPSLNCLSLKNAACIIERSISCGVQVWVSLIVYILNP